MKEGSPKGPEEKTGYKVADWIEKKSLLVGGTALVAGFLVPALLGIAETIALWESVQVAGAEVYKGHAKAKEMKAGKEYALAA